MTYRLSLFLVVLSFLACNPIQPTVAISENELPESWAKMTLYITQHTPSNSPTFASRAFGYIGLTMYESVVHSDSSYRSLSGQLNQLTSLPLPHNNLAYSWSLAFNAAQAEILRLIYIQTDKENKMKIDSLENAVFHAFADTINDQGIADRSVSYGKALASSIFEWSKTDGGHRGYLANYDNKFKPPSTPGSWKPPFFAQQISRLPLHPKWGENRTFLKADANWPRPPFIPYDTSWISDSYKQFAEVYKSNKQLTQEQKEIAIWWNDDPSETYTPPGHSFNLGLTVNRIQKSGLVEQAETYARIGLAVADAFIVCWKMKYDFFSERPSTFVNENIDDEWDPFWPDPPFPAFPSGHATQAGAVATVLAGLFGENLTFIDSTHVGRQKDRLRNAEYKPRKFDSFWQVAEETAYSRYLGGIHTAQDNTVGLNEGRKVGKHINDLNWRH